MNNNEFMKLLSVISKKHNSQKNLIIFITGIAFAGIAGFFFMRSKYLGSNRNYNALKSEYDKSTRESYINALQLRSQKDKIIKQENIINQLVSEKEMRNGNNIPSYLKI